MKFEAFVFLRLAAQKDITAFDTVIIWQLFGLVGE